MPNLTCTIISLWQVTPAVGPTSYQPVAQMVATKP